MLDFCCGTGLVSLLAKGGVAPSGRVVEVDISNKMLDEGRRKAAKAGPEMIFINGDVTNINRENMFLDNDQSFGFITCAAALVLLENPVSALNHWATTDAVFVTVLFSTTPMILRNKDPRVPAGVNPATSRRKPGRSSPASTRYSPPCLAQWTRSSFHWGKALNRAKCHVLVHGKGSLLRSDTWGLQSRPRRLQCVGKANIDNYAIIEYEQQSALSDREFNEKGYVRRSRLDSPWVAAVGSWYGEEDEEEEIEDFIARKKSICVDWFSTECAETHIMCELYIDYIESTKSVIQISIGSPWLHTVLS